MIVIVDRQGLISGLKCNVQYRAIERAILSQSQVLSLELTYLTEGCVGLTLVGPTWPLRYPTTNFLTTTTNMELVWRGRPLDWTARERFGYARLIWRWNYRGCRLQTCTCFSVFPNKLLTLCIDTLESMLRAT